MGVLWNYARGHVCVCVCVYVCVCVCARARAREREREMCYFWRVVDKHTTAFWFMWKAFGSVQSATFICPAGRSAGPCPSVHPSVRLSAVRGSLKRWTLCPKNFSAKFFNPFHACRHHCLLPFLCHFRWHWLWLGSQGQRKAKPVDLIFSRTLQLIRMNFGVV